MRSCQSITKLPDFCAPNLETLDISYCDNLIEIHDSIGLLDKLECLELRSCKELQILPSTLKVNERFGLWNCIRLEKFSNVHPEMKCFRSFIVDDSNIREWPSSLRYLTKGIIKLEILQRDKFSCPSSNHLEILLDRFEDLILRFYGEILIDLNFCVNNDFFPALRYVKIESNIVSIPECIFSVPRLEEICIRKCQELREIQFPRLPQSIRHVIIEECPSLREIQFPRLPQSIRRVIIEECPLLLPQSSSRLLNQVRSLSLIIK